MTLVVPIRTALVFLGVLVAAQGCGGIASGDDGNGDRVPDGASEEGCAGFQARLVACGIAPAGNVRCADGGDFSRCITSCFAAASCPDLEGELCVLGLRSTRLQNCIDRCSERHGLFRCDDGQSIIGSGQCDGRLECDDGSDEADCPTFDCDDGSRIGAALRCDRREDCQDASDEAECAEIKCPL